MTDVRRPISEHLDLRGRTAIVTGASSGLGARFVRVLVDAGATVYAAARRADRLEDLAATSDRVRPVVCDVAREGDRQELIETAAAEDRRIDILVNNAGTAGPPRVEDETDDAIAHVLAVNLLAPVRLATLAVERAAPTGLSIVNVASIVGLVSTAPLGGASYAASKGGLVSVTRELAGQWGSANVRVNALAPGWFATEMTAELFDDERSGPWIERNTMLGRAGQAHELDGALLFLTSDASSYFTGQTLVVDGGWTAR